MQATVVGTEVEVVYEEPTVNADGSPIVDLDHTSVYGDSGSGPSKVADVPATSSTGGGMITQRVTFPVAENQESNVTIFATATDSTGNEGPRSPEVVVRIDRLPPGPPV